MSCPSTTSMGALVLDLLSPAQSEELRAHAHSCAECSAALAELTPLVPLLDRSRAETPVPDELAFRRLQAQASAYRRNRLIRRVLVAAAAVLVLLGGGGLLLARQGTPGTTVSAASGAVQARAVLSDTSAGTRITLRLRGVTPGLHCRLVALGRDGHVEVASTWLADYAGAATVSGTVSMPQDQIDQLRVETLDGAALVTLPTH